MGGPFCLSPVMLNVCDHGKVSLAKALFGAAIVSSMMLGACTTSHPDSSGWSRRRGSTVITGGAVNGERWELVAFVNHAGQRCVEVRSAEGDSASCTNGPLTEAVSVARNDLPTANQSTVSFISGQVAHNMTRLTIEFPDGKAWNIPVVGAGAGFDVNFFAVQFDPSSRPIALTAAEAGDQVVTRTALPFGPRPGCGSL